MISFFAKESFILKGHAMRVSSIIRCDQIANYLGARINPAENYENGTCIYVKPHVSKGCDFEFKGHPYLDIIDGWGLLPMLEKHPEVPVIACSKRDQEILSKRIKNKVLFLPQHHCNFERIKRTRKEINTVGVIGTAGAFPYLPKGLKEALADRGINLVEFSQFFKREDIINFYLNID